MKKSCISLALIILMSICFSTLGAVAEQEVYTTISCEISSESSENQSSIRTDTDISSFSIDITITTNTQQNFTVKVLSNFEFIPFSLNGSECSYKYVLAVNPRNDVMISRGNTILLTNMKNFSNDVCILFVSKYAIYTQRISVVNRSSKTFSDNVEMQLVKNHSVFPGESTIYISEARNCNGQIAKTLNVNFDSLLIGSSFEPEYLKSSGEAVDYALLAVDEYGNFVESVRMFSSEQHAFSLVLTNVPANQPYYYILFPYANSYSSEYLYTYKQVMWSSPLTLFVAHSC